MMRLIIIFIIIIFIISIMMIIQLGVVCDGLIGLLVLPGNQFPSLIHIILTIIIVRIMIRIIMARILPRAWII